MKSKFLVGVLVLATLVVPLQFTLAASTSANPRSAVVDGEWSIPDFITNCVGNAQLCGNKFSTTIESVPSKEIYVNYTVRNTHCSSVRVHLFVDGVEKDVTPWLGWGGAYSSFSSLPLATGNVNLGKPKGGGITHEVSLEAEGQVGGCNGGILGSWGGSLEITAEK